MLAVAAVEDDEKVKIQLRAPKPLKQLIDRAADIKRQSRTEFMLNAARVAAEDALLDQRLFLLDEERWDAFQKSLDAPLPTLDKIKRLIETKPVWEK